MDFNSPEGAHIFGSAIDLALNSGEATAELTDGGAIIRVPGKGGLQSFLNYMPRYLAEQHSKAHAELKAVVEGAEAAIEAAREGLEGAQKLITDERAAHRSEVKRLEALIDQAATMMSPGVLTVFRQIRRDAEGNITSSIETRPLGA